MKRKNTSPISIAVLAAILSLATFLCYKTLLPPKCEWSLEREDLSPDKVHVASIYQRVCLNSWKIKVYSEVLRLQKSIHTTLPSGNKAPDDTILIVTDRRLPKSGTLWMNDKVIFVNIVPDTFVGLKVLRKDGVDLRINKPRSNVPDAEDIAILPRAN